MTITPAMHSLHIMASKGHGGAETYCADLLCALAQSGIRQTAIIAAGNNNTSRLRQAGVDVCPAPLRWPFGFLQRRTIQAVIAETKPDLIHAWMRRGASLIPAGLSIPAIGWFGGYYDVSKFNRCSHFIGVTADLVRHIRSALPSERHAQVYLQTTFAHMDLSVAAVDRKALHTPADKPLLLVLARLHPKKGLDTLLRAMQQMPDTYCWIAGDGPLEQELKKLCRDLRLEDRVRFLGWRDDRAALLKACDLLVVPSRYEPFGTVVLEAWMAKKPVVAARAVGPAATVTDQANGLLVPVDDAAALAAACQTILNNPARAATLAANGANTYNALYSPAISTQRMKELYARIIQSHR